MEDLSPLISNETYNLLSKHSEIQKNSDAVKSEINSYLEYSESENKMINVKTIETGKFNEIPGSAEIIATANNIVTKIVSTQQEKKNLDTRMAENTNKIIQLKKSSKVMVWVIMAIIILIVFVTLVNK